LNYQSSKINVDKVIYQRMYNLVGFLFKACERNPKFFERIENFFEHKYEHMQLFKSFLDSKMNKHNAIDINGNDPSRIHD